MERSMGCTISREPGERGLPHTDNPLGERVNDTVPSSPTPPVQLQQLSRMRAPRHSRGEQATGLREEARRAGIQSAESPAGKHAADHAPANPAPSIRLQRLSQAMPPRRSSSGQVTAPHEDILLEREAIKDKDEERRDRLSQLIPEYFGRNEIEEDKKHIAMWVVNYHEYAFRRSTANVEISGPFKGNETFSFEKSSNRDAKDDDIDPFVKR
ncbi:hypothetical protein [Burkholderia arboris]|nr:hypothetical protein [Burkholderia arboris]